MHDYRDCYAVLGVSPDTEWEMLRAHYRRLISQWHPDRFAADTGQRRLAEERSKQITAAYHALEKYRREHGALPFLAPAEVPDDMPAQPREADPASAGAPASHRSEMGTAGSVVPRGAKRGRWRRVALAGGFLATGLYFAHDYLGQSMPDDAITANSADRQRIPQMPRGRAEYPAGSRIISIGSTLGDVFAIQGIPTRTQGETWHYGKSEVHFARGKVVAWAEDPDFPLRIARNLPVQLHGGTFQIGSTKEEVRATQGTPVTESASVWDYGLSRVYFEDDRVIRWEESPIQPLHVAR